MITIMKSERKVRLLLKTKDKESAERDKLTVAERVGGLKVI